jgi:hypothetical protein
VMNANEWMDWRVHTHTHTHLQFTIPGDIFYIDANVQLLKLVLYTQN